MLRSGVGALVCLVAVGLCAAEGPTKQELNELKKELRQALLADKHDQAVAAVKKIATSDTKLGALLLLGLAHNSPGPVYEAARDGLAGLTSPEVDSMITRKCKLGRPEEQLLIADALAKRGGGFAELSLGQLLERPDPRVVRAALVAVQQAQLKDMGGAIAMWLESAAPNHGARLLGQKVVADFGGDRSDLGPSCGGGPILGNHVVFVVDVSEGMGKQGRLDAAKAAVREGIKALKPEQRYTVLTYSGHVREGLAKPEMGKRGYPDVIDGVTWLQRLGPRVEFAKENWNNKGFGFLDGLKAGGAETFALRALEAALQVPVTEAVVLISSGAFTDVDHDKGERFAADALAATVRAANRSKRIVINVRTFAGADAVFKQLAETSGGTYAELKQARGGEEEKR